MELQQMKTLEKSIRNNQDSLLASLVKQNGFQYSSIFNNCGQKPLGEVMYQTIKDLVIMSKQCWQLDKDDFKEWIDEAFDEVETVED